MSANYPSISQRASYSSIRDYHYHQKNTSQNNLKSIFPHKDVNMGITCSFAIYCHGACHTSLFFWIFGIWVKYLEMCKVMVGVIPNLVHIQCMLMNKNLKKKRRLCGICIRRYCMMGGWRRTFRKRNWKIVRITGSFETWC